MFGLNKYWTLGVCLVLAIVGFAGGWAVNGMRLNRQIADIKAEQTQNELKAQQAIKEKETQYKAEMDKQASEYQSAVSSSSADIEKLKRELANVSKKNPLPSTCRITDDRMSIIRKAINRANVGSKS